MSPEKGIQCIANTSQKNHHSDTTKKSPAHKSAMALFADILVQLNQATTAWLNKNVYHTK